MVPGWPHSFVAALESVTTSWTALLDAVRLRPGQDATAITAGQLRGVVDRLITSGQRQHTDREILVVVDAVYDVARLAWLLADLPVVLVGPVRSDRAFHAPARERGGASKGRSPRHGANLALRDPATYPIPACATKHALQRYGTIQAVAFECIRSSNPEAGSRTTKGSCRSSKAP